jgi:K+-sensing histidine kinase KdpD
VEKMRNILLIIILSLPLFSFSQDTIVDRKIRPVWVEPETVFKPKQEKIEETPKVEEEELAVVENVKKDLQFLESLPKTYDALPKDDLKNVLKEIDNKISRLLQERDSLLQAKVVNQKLVETKEGTIKTLKKEKNIVSLTLESGDLKDQNGNLIVDKENLKSEKETYQKYLYAAVVGLILLALGVMVLLQRKTIRVKDGEIESQLDDINKKNTYLEHAARIIRHDMHSGINTYIPRGLTSLEKRIPPEDVQNLKIETSLKMIKDGLAHTQRVYKSVYEFTNLVKQNVVLDKKLLNIGEILQKYISNTSYSSQVKLEGLSDLEVNDVLFCNAVDNLIKNGLKYNDSEDKYVRIYMEEENLVVQDNGRGLTKNQFEKIIKHKKEEKEEGEMGLGLSISNVIFKEHGFVMLCDKNDIGTKIIIKLK